MFHNNNKKNLQSQHIQHFSCEHNTSQIQQQVEHEIVQMNIWTQNSKESNSQNTLKNLYVGNSNKNMLEEDLYELLGWRNTTYCKENLCVKIVLSESGLARGFVFITAPNHICTKLIKVNGTDFKSHYLIVAEALVKPKVKEPSPLGNKTTEIKITRHLLKKFQ